MSIIPPQRRLLYESLHNHTLWSDGTLSHIAVLVSAENHQVGAIAFTDHDTLIPESELEKLYEYNGPVKWISGIEISSCLPKEMGSRHASSFHIVGLFVDPFDHGLRHHCAMMQESRKERMVRMTANLIRYGFRITEDDCYAESKGEAVGRSHISRALLKRPENIARFRELAESMCNVARADEKVRVEYNAMMDAVSREGDVAYMFPLMLGENAFISDVYVPYLYATDMDESVRLIRGAGGLAFVAHYPTVQGQIRHDEMCRYLSDKRIDGLEAVIGTMKNIPYDPDTLENMVRETGCLRSVGADTHREDDLIAFVRRYWDSNKTNGTLQEIIDRAHPSLTFTNIK